jgi:hypothetical protein
LCCGWDSLQSLYWEKSVIHPYYTDLESVKPGKAVRCQAGRLKLRIYNGFQSNPQFP